MVGIAEAAETSTMTAVHWRVLWTRCRLQRLTSDRLERYPRWSSNGLLSDSSVSIQEQA